VNDSYAERLAVIFSEVYHVCNKFNLLRG
jgi:hypothetical protein